GVAHDILGTPYGIEIREVGLRHKAQGARRGALGKGRHRKTAVRSQDPLPGCKMPSSGRRSASAALTVDAATTSGSGMPMHRNLDMVVTWSKAGPLMHRICTSEEMVSG